MTSQPHAAGHPATLSHATHLNMSGPELGLASRPLPLPSPRQRHLEPNPVLAAQRRHTRRLPPAAQPHARRVLHVAVPAHRHTRPQTDQPLVRAM